MAALSAAGHSIVVSDLYAEGFNPVAGRHDFTTVADADRFHYQAEQSKAALENGFALDIAREQARVAAADLLILQYPMWWGGVPAVLKGWFDRVLAYGFAYVDGRRFDTGLFKGKRAMLSVTTGATQSRYSVEGVYGEIERALWQTQKLTLEYMGLAVAEPFVAYAAPRVDDERRAQYLNELAGRVVALAALPVGRPPEPVDALAAVGNAAWTRQL